MRIFLLILTGSLLCLSTVAQVTKINIAEINGTWLEAGMSDDASATDWLESMDEPDRLIIDVNPLDGEGTLTTKGWPKTTVEPIKITTLKDGTVEIRLPQREYNNMGLVYKLTPSELVIDFSKKSNKIHGLGSAWRWIRS